MNLFKRKKTPENPAEPTGNQTALADVALKAIHDGVVITDKAGKIKFINPAALTMTDLKSPNDAIGLEYNSIIKLESKEGRELSENENPFIQAMQTNQPLDAFRGSLIVGNTDKRLPIAISVLSADGFSGDRIITFRNITKELQEEGEQTEFISTASHEMRTPVATIDGYITLTLNPQTATIDERARGYLTSASQASKHLGKLFQDLLDVTKLDDGRIHPNLEPAEMVELVKTISNDYIPQAAEKKITLTFGTNDTAQPGGHHMDQVVYGFIDPDFMREILDNLVGNALKYTPDGGSVYLNVRGDGDRVLINVTDSGVGISADDIAHIFQKFYRADNSDTRTIGGTGLGLCITKQRVEAMGGKIWAESAFGEGSTFYVSLPRLTSDEYEKRMIPIRQAQMAEQLARAQQPAPQPVVPTSQPVIAAPQPVAPQPAPTPQPVAPQPAPAPQPIPQLVAPQPAPQPIPQPVAPQPIPQPTPTPPQPAPQPPVQNQIINNPNEGVQPQ